MRKIFLSMLVALIAMTSCEKSDLNGSLSGETAKVTISAEATSVTRALGNTNEDDVLTYYVEIYLGETIEDGDVPFRDLTKTATKDISEVTFDVELFTNNTYTVLAWADYGGGYYNTDDLTNVTIKTASENYAINTTQRDAFAGKATMNVSAEGKGDIEMELVRPFGRVNVKSTDDIPEGFAPSTVKITYDIIYTTYNILNGSVGGEVYDQEASSMTVDYLEYGETYTSYEGNLSTDYLFSPLEGSITVSFDQTYSKAGQDITTYTGFTNIPVQANYQTNVSGKILTDGGTINIDVNQDWAGELVEAIDQKTLQQAIEDGVEMIVLSDSFDITETIKVADGQNVTIDGSNISGASSVLSRATSSDNYTLTMTGTAQFVIGEGASLTVNNITLDASTAIAAIYLNGDGCSLTANGATIIQSAHSTTGFTAGSSPAIEVNQTAYADDISMTFNDSHIKLTGRTGTKTGINIYGDKTNKVENYSIIFNNSSIIADKNSDGAQSLYAQAICVGNIKNLNIEMYNSIFQDLSYPIYCTNISDINDAPEMNFTIDNSTIDGWCAMNLRCNNSTINVVNGSQLIGRNHQSGSSNGYSIIVMSGYTGSTATEPYISQVANTTINIVDSYMLAESYGNAGLYILDERNVYNEDNNVINFKGNTVLESNKISGDYTYVDPFFVKYAPMTEGKSNLKVTRDQTVEVKTNMDGMRFSEGLIIGEGTEEDPYQIFDNGDLSILKYYTTASYSAYFKQMANIEYEYTPYAVGQTPAYGAPTVTITSSSYSVSGLETTYAAACNLNGTYDGGGFAINNFRYDESVLGSNTSDQLVGLFNTVKPNSAIKNLSLTTDSNVGITIPEANVNSSAMKVGSFAGKLEGTITGCNSEIPITVYGTDAEYTGVGGIAGWFASDYWTYIAEAYCTEVTYCTYSGDLTVTNAGIGAGMAAYCNAYWGDISYDTMSGSITAPTAYGICESSYDDGNNTISGTVTSTSEQ